MAVEIDSSESIREKSNSGLQRALRIAYITPFYAPILTGVSLAVHRRVLWLLRRGHRIHLIRPDVDEQFSEEIRSRPMPGLSELAGFPGFSTLAYPCQPHPLSRSNPVPRSFRHWNVTSVLESFCPDVILLEDFTYLVGLSSPHRGGYRQMIAANYARRAGIPTVTLVETDWLAYGQLYFGRWLTSLARPILVPLIRRLSAAYDLNLFCSRASLMKYQSFGAAAAEMLPFHGIAADEYQTNHLRPDPLPGDNRPMLLYVARFSREKNVPVLLQAFSRIRDAVPNAHLVLIGAGSLDADLKRQAAPFGNSVTMPGEVFGEQLKAWYARADVYVNPSVTETFCTANLEALASGTPVIAAAAGGNTEQITHEQNGLLARPNDSEDLACQTIRFLQEDELRSRLQSQAAPSVQQFDWELCCERIEAILHRVTAKPTMPQTKS